MTAQEIRKAYLDFFMRRGHAAIARARLVPQDDPTTLFTGSGMQPLIPYLLGEEHPEGSRLVNSQACLRAQDIDEVGDNRHTTFFEMLGNWSLGDYFKKEQIPWFWDFLTKTIGLDPNRIYVTCYSGNEAAGIPRDTDSAMIWSELFLGAGLDAKQIEVGTEEIGYARGEQGGRIFFYGDKNWWSREGAPSKMSPGEPGGPDTEVFYLYPQVPHDKKWGRHCHPNCDCGRYIELGNSVFMEYLKTEKGFKKLPKRNVDYGGGLERIAAAAMDSPDVFRVSLLWPIIEELERLSGKTYKTHTNAMRVIADHLRGAVFLAVDGVVPGNKEQGYVMRRLVRRAVLRAFDLGIEQNLLECTAAVIADVYDADFPEVAKKRADAVNVLSKEERVFRQTLRKGLKEFERIAARRTGESALSVAGQATSQSPKKDSIIAGEDIFRLYDTYGFPVELSLEEAAKRGITVSNNWKHDFDAMMRRQRQRSQTAAKGVFKGGLSGQTLQHKKYHTATHLMYQALRDVLGDHVIQRGSNITEERLRFDFSHGSKLTPEQIKRVEDIVNREIERDLKITWREYPTKVAIEEKQALGQFGDRYGDTVKVYSMRAAGAVKPYSFEICGGPHVDHTSQLAESASGQAKKFKIIKEVALATGIRRIKAVLE